jgi:SAM-dependent methyltransferase
VLKIAIFSAIVNDSSSHLLQDWFAAPRGTALLQSESALLRESLEDCFGWEMLQLGAWGSSRSLLAHARTRSQTLIAGHGENQVDLKARLTQLPIQSDSVDAVLLPHTLEFEVDPYALLREVDRVLAGDGKLLVLGFVPLSPWGLRAMASRQGYPPGLRRLLSEGRLRDWLRLLGYDVLDVRRYLYELPWGEPREPSLRVRRGWFYPLPAGGFLLKARKRLHALTPLRPMLRERRRAVLGGLVEPSSANRSGTNAP